MARRRSERHITIRTASHGAKEESAKESAAQLQKSGESPLRHRALRLGLHSAFRPVPAQSRQPPAPAVLPHLFTRRPPTPKELEERRLVEEVRLTAEAAADDEEWMTGLRAWLEETLADEAMGDDALDEALCAEIAARRARKQAVERLRVEEVLRKEARKNDRTLS